MSMIDNKNILQQWKQENPFLNKVIVHLFYWLVGFLILFIPLLFPLSLNEAFRIASGIVFPNIIVIYLHFYIFNKYFQNRKYRHYVAALILIAIVGGLFMEFLFNSITTDGNISGILLALMSISFSTGMKYLKSNAKQKYHLKEAQVKQTEMELTLLKSQVNPHFFFNTLNNLYSLSLDKSDKVPDVILRLSDLISYMLESSKDKYVELSREVDFIQSYLSLERLRFSEDSDIQFRINGDLTDKKIAPMLLIPFVENSFKHGVTTTVGDFYVYINLNVSDEKVQFEVKNNKPENYKPDQKSSPKTGLKNVTKRLDLLYPDKYGLKITDGNGFYNVNLEVAL